MNTQLMLLWDKLTIYCSQELWVFISGSCNRKGREGREERGGEKKKKKCTYRQTLYFKIDFKMGWMALPLWLKTVNLAHPSPFLGTLHASHMGGRWGLTLWCPHRAAAWVPARSQHLVAGPRLTAGDGLMGWSPPQIHAATQCSSTRAVLPEQSPRLRLPILCQCCVAGSLRASQKRSQPYPLCCPGYRNSQIFLFVINWLTLRNHQFKTHFRQSYWNALCMDMAVYLNYTSPQKVPKTSLIIF